MIGPSLYDIAESATQTGCERRNAGGWPHGRMPAGKAWQSAWPGAWPDPCSDTRGSG